MLIKLFLDRDGKQIDTEKVYNDIWNEVPDVKIIEIDGNYYASPDGLEAEPLSNVCGGLVEKI
ncbi:MAG TPA: hypothetical protein DEQ64_03045 [Lachnoclostridium sp.]|jgi:hypothetical protein|uniref:hypothetical protein n=1 Tax=Lacrimispora sp. TaxID=2719234 RepID=UPI000EC2CBD9|nr:hypothetical protein [Lacrimispora sp.]HCD42714.1 hypothetical protein [Lachnoclostridium sp.]